MDTSHSENKSREFITAHHTIVLSDIHLSDAEPTHPLRPLWKRYKRRKLFIDRSFDACLKRIQEEIIRSGDTNEIELVLNGDIFDFDSVMQIPPDPPFDVNFLERLRGLTAEESKSIYKTNLILKDHAVFTRALRKFIVNGNRLVFIIGNHDVELFWPGVQAEIIRLIGVPEELTNNIRFCDWFYISNQDTLIEHGNQYDEYCACINPIHPLIRKGHKTYVRLPFGNIAGRYMMNGMGLMNPHVDASYIKPFWGHIVFFFKYQLKTQPLIMWDWLWGALVTLVYSVGDGLLPAMKDPLMLEPRLEAIAAHANADPRVVRGLRELHVHPAIFKPLQILRELWLDRAALLATIFVVCFEFFLILEVSVDVSYWWFVVPFFLTLPLFLFYARSVNSQMNKLHRRIFKRVPLSAQIAKVNRVIQGHTHIAGHTSIRDVEYLNTGTWSPAFNDVECTKPLGDKYFAWVAPERGSRIRKAGLYRWNNPGIEKIDITPFEVRISKKQVKKSK